MNNEEKILEILHGMSGKIDNLERDVREIKSRVENVENDIREIKVKVEDLEEDNKEIILRVEHINKTVNIIFEDISRHDMRLDRHERILKG